MIAGFGLQALVLILSLSAEPFAIMEEIQDQSPKPEAQSPKPVSSVPSPEPSVHRPAFHIALT